MQRFNKNLVSINHNQKVIGNDPSMNLEENCECGLLGTHLYSMYGSEKIYCNKKKFIAA